MLTVAVLISGTGSNLRALLDAAADPEFPARIVAVGADREAEGFAHAEEYGIPTFMVPFARFASRDEWGAELGAQLDVWRPDLVVLSGLMRLLPASLVDAWSPHIVNTHPAYLPEFPARVEQSAQVRPCARDEDGDREHPLSLTAAARPPGPSSPGRGTAEQERGGQRSA